MDKMVLFDGRPNTMDRTKTKARIGVLAIDHAAKGGQALHVWRPNKKSFPDAPDVFKNSEDWAHLLDMDKERLIKTAKRLGVKVIKVEREGQRGQHVDLCARPLRRAINECLIQTLI